MNTRWNRFVAGWCVPFAALLVTACAAPGPIPATTQPALSAMAQPYGDGLRKAGVNSVQPGIESLSDKERNGIFEGNARVLFNRFAL